MTSAVTSPIESATRVVGIAKQWSAVTDRENRFPREALRELQHSGLLGLMAPDELGGGGGSFALLAKVSAILAQGCPSTAIIWAMHSQQVMTLAEHGRPGNDDVLRSVVGDGMLIASVTSEFETGGQLLSAQAPLEPRDGRIHVCRSSPIVSYAAEAKYFLVTMRSSAEAGSHDVRLVLISREDGDIRVTGSWDAMGMRGTQSVPVTIDALVDERRALPEDFRTIAAKTFVPAAHIGWAASWHGAAIAAVARVTAWIRKRNSEGSARVDPDLVFSRLAELRARLDAVGALIERIALRLDRFREERGSASHYEETTHQIELNSLKIVSSEVSFSVVNDLVEIVGLDEGYRADGMLGLEQLFRDLRSASLMYRNERLRQANGRLMLIEHGSSMPFWRREEPQQA